MLEELDRREPDSASFIRPQEHKADLVVSFQPGSEDRDDEHLDAVLTMREGLPHPDLSVIDEEKDRITLEERGETRCLYIPGNVDRDRGSAIEEAIWEKMQFASHLRTERLGEFTVGDEVHRSESLAIVQVLILYHLVTAKAAVAVAGDETSSRSDAPHPEQNATTASQEV